MNTRVSSTYKGAKWREHKESIKWTKSPWPETSQTKRWQRTRESDYKNSVNCRRYAGYVPAKRPMANKWTWFQTIEEYFPNQFRHPNKRSTTLLGNTHPSPNKRKKKIITSKDLTPCCTPNKKYDPLRGFDTPNTFSREIHHRRTPQSNIERSSIK